jgi:hypothetical protein
LQSNGMGRFRALRHSAMVPPPSLLLVLSLVPPAAEG